MRKNSIFTILAVILPLTVANADEITNLTLDTPVNWPVSAFNMAIARTCIIDESLPRYVRDPDTGGVGRFELAKNDDDEGILVTVADLESKCGHFVLQYADFYKRQLPSLRDILDICMNTIGDAGTCARFAQILVDRCIGASMKRNDQGAIETDIIESVNAADEIFEDGPFYFKPQVTYSDYTVELVDNNLYLKDTNSVVGKCRTLGDLVGDCDAAVQDYASWHCSFSLVDRHLSCFDGYEYLIQAVVDTITDRIKEVKAIYVNPKLSSAVRACAEKYKMDEISRLEGVRNEYETAKTVYSYSMWKAAKEFVRKSIDYVYGYGYEIENEIETKCGL